jgi:hypothetical protein
VRAKAPFKIMVAVWAALLVGTAAHSLWWAAATFILLFALDEIVQDAVTAILKGFRS